MRLNRTICFLGIVVVLIGLLRLSNRNKAERIFGNATYIMGNEHVAQAITLVNGVFEEPYLNVRYDHQYVFGDFNHDGLNDAGVILVENNGGNADWYTLAFLINDGQKLVHRASRILDDRAIINTLKEEQGKIIIHMLVHQGGDCMAGPTKRVRNIYEYDRPDVWIAAAG